MFDFYVVAVAVVVFAESSVIRFFYCCTVVCQHSFVSVGMCVCNTTLCAPIAHSPRGPADNCVFSTAASNTGGCVY